MRFEAVVAAFLLFALPGLTRADEPPAALVMAVSGSITPPIAVMSEIPSGAHPSGLRPGAELTFLHYTRCKMITVTGGTVTVTRSDVVTDGKTIGELDAPCPRVHQLGANAAGTVAGGLVMRGLSSPPRWPLNREIVLAGNGTDRLIAAAIYAEGRLDAPLIRLDVAGHQVRFPANSAPLAVNERYVLRLTIGDRAAPVDISFIGAAPSGPNLHVVLHGQ